MGLMSSSDGFIWEAINLFNNMNMISMDSYQNHTVVSEFDNMGNIYYSDDGGENWGLSSTPLFLNCIEFDNEGKLYGILPDESWSSGIYVSEDYGQTWEVEFWSANINCIGLDIFNHLFTGWKDNPNSYEQGIAFYDQENDTLILKNEGLTNLIINDILINPMMSAIAMFCCTEAGCFITYDISETDDRKFETENILEAYPNPGSDRIYLKINLNEKINGSIKIYNTTGNLLRSYSVNKDNTFITISRNSFSPGSYHIVFYQEGVKLSSSKIIIL